MKSKVKVLAELVSGEAFLFALLMAAFSLCVLVAFSLRDIERARDGAGGGESGERE